MVLQLLKNEPGISIAGIAEALLWRLPDGQSPAKAKAQRVLRRLRDAKLVKFSRGEWQLTEAGKQAVGQMSEKAEK